MKVKKYLGKSVNGFTIMDTYPVVLESGKKTRKVLVKCDKCGREFERNSGVDFSHIKCKCMCAPIKPTKFHYIEFEGAKYTLTQFANAHNINIRTLSDRITAGESPEQAIKIEIEKECACCGKKFIGMRKKRYCSDKCSNYAYKQIYKKRISKTKNPDRSINLIKLYKRDKGICQICGKQINFDCDYNSKDYPSIDHIKPLSRGGLHTWDNVQLSCRGCNIHKGNNLKI